MPFGVHSEVGKLRKVMVHRPGLEHSRLTPSNAEELLFDDVLWVHAREGRARHVLRGDARARRRGVPRRSSCSPRRWSSPKSKDWVCDHILNERQIGITAAQRAREWVETADAAQVADFLIGGITKADVEQDVGLVWESADPTSMLLPPLPNFLFQRDPSCWIFDGVTLNPMTKPARKPETMIIEAIYRFHPMFAAEQFPIWLGGADEDWGRAHVEGGDVQPIGNGAVMIGMGERTTPQAVLWIARSLFRAGSADVVLAVHLPKSRSYMHLDTVITMCDRDLVTLFPQVVVRRAHVGDPAGRHRPTTSSSRSSRARCPSSWPRRSASPKMRVVETGGDAFEAEREQWDDGNNVVALEPGVVVAYERNVGTNTALRKAGHRGHHDRGLRARSRPRRLALHDLPARARPRVLSRGASRCRSTCGTAASSRRSTSSRASCASCCSSPRRSRSRSTPAPRRKRLDGKEIALIFEKTSTRTRSAFEVAAFDQGAHVTYLDPSGSQMGHKESIADTARVLGRMYDAIEYRGNTQADVETLAEYAGVPVYNGLTAEWHPTQMLADFLTMHEASDKPYDATRLRVRRRLPLQHGPLAARHGRAHGQRRPPRRARGAAPAEGRRRPRARDRGAHRRAHHHHRRRRPRRSPVSTSSTPTCGCRWAKPRTSGPTACSC